VYWAWREKLPLCPFFEVPETPITRFIEEELPGATFKDDGDADGASQAGKTLDSGNGAKEYRTCIGLAARLTFSQGYVAVTFNDNLEPGVALYAKVPLSGNPLTYRLRGIGVAIFRLELCCAFADGVATRQAASTRSAQIIADTRHRKSCISLVKTALYEI
jgi:hypothetical protein